MCNVIEFENYTIVKKVFFFLCVYVIDDELIWLLDVFCYRVENCTVYIWLKKFLCVDILDVEPVFIFSYSERL